MKDYEESIRFSQKSRDLIEKIFGNEDEQYGEVVMNIGNTQILMGKQKQGVNNLQIAHEIFSKIQNRRNDYEFILIILAEYFFKSGNYEKALTKFQ